MKADIGLALTAPRSSQSFQVTNLANRMGSYRHPQHWTLQDSLIAACAVLLPVLLWPFVKFAAHYPGVPA